MRREQVGWLVGCFGFNGPLRQYFSLYRAVLPKRGRKRRERTDESRNVQTTPTRTYCKRSRPLPCCNQNCRTPRHWKFTQHFRTTRPPPSRTRATLLGYRSRSQSALKLCAHASIKLVHVRTIFLSCMVGFENNVVQIIIITKQCVMNKNHVVRSKVYVTVHTLTLCIDFSETCSYLPITWSTLLGFINNAEQIIIMTIGCVVNKNCVASSKIKLIGLT